MTKSRANASIDRRSLRTRTALRDALLELIAVRGWDDIAVRDVCERANIGRSTFYLHYPNKDALLQGGLEDLQAELRRQARARPDDACPGPEALEGFHFALGLIEHVDGQRKVFRSVIGRRSGYVIQQRFREMVVRLFTDELPAATGSFPHDAVARWLAGAFVELLSWWIDQHPRLSPKELALLFNELSRSAREGARVI